MNPILDRHSGACHVVLTFNALVIFEFCKFRF